REYNLDVVDENGTVFYAVDEPSGAWDLEIKYPRRKETYHVPVCVIGKNLYLDFAVKTNSFTDSKNELYGFFKDEGHASGILISPPYFSKELTCYYVTDDAVYTLRYWRTDMDYDEEKTATFSDKGDVYQVPAHLRAGGNTYTCVNGRGTKIRNITKGSSFPKEYRANRVAIEHSGPDAESETQVTVTGTIVVFGKPYLTLVPDSAKIEDIIAEDKKRKRPEREPLFPPHGVLDFDWSVVPQKLEDRFKRNLD
ncbi:MAG: hypothetical protein J6Z17_04705, partial [Treponema sp.]|nr:hypothetical protein [Treponema sp.]